MNITIIDIFMEYPKGKFIDTLNPKTAGVG